MLFIQRFYRGYHFFRRFVGQIQTLFSTIAITCPQSWLDPGTLTNLRFNSMYISTSQTSISGGVLTLEENQDFQHFITSLDTSSYLYLTSSQLGS